MIINFMIIIIIIENGKCYDVSVPRSLHTRHIQKWQMSSLRDLNSVVDRLGHAP